IEQMWQHGFCQCVEGLSITKEGCHRNEEVGEKRLRLICVLAQEIVIVLQLVSPGDLHATRNAPQHGGLLVFGKIMSGPDPQMGEDTTQQLLVEISNIR